MRRGGMRSGDLELPRGTGIASEAPPEVSALNASRDIRAERFIHRLDRKLGSEAFMRACRRAHGEHSPTPRRLVTARTASPVPERPRGALWLAAKMFRACSLGA
jgi:hypothetical protein